ncbi:MAG: hypothetical protein AVDCRST_MAG56-3526 [uncultured Cytophagales bacterium]|uniref:Uncharacterized protein n=1 Tax=uncultured Cytophagales bacterium TaxID=158755 RepID=A0A6J4JIK0_9SPHI|nr:MAG: hypothetical protein AVDCRST_MAG56-3526 [uncultured Cytophagales bacterium]
MGVVCPKSSYPLPQPTTFPVNPASGMIGTNEKRRPQTGGKETGGGVPGLGW